jgi:hypothetical protein
MEFVSVENERLLPQQTASSVTNIDDVETYSGDRERDRDARYLDALDIRRSKRDKIVRELSLKEHIGSGPLCWYYCQSRKKAGLLVRNRTLCHKKGPDPMVQRKCAPGQEKAEQDDC